MSIKSITYVPLQRRPSQSLTYYSNNDSTTFFRDNEGNLFAKQTNPDSRQSHWFQLADYKLPVPQDQEQQTATTGDSEKTSSQIQPGLYEPPGD